MDSQTVSVQQARVTSFLNNLLSFYTHFSKMLLEIGDNPEGFPALEFIAVVHIPGANVRSSNTMIFPGSSLTIKVFVTSSALNLLS